MNENLVKQRIFFFGMVAILAVLTLILIWRFVGSILLAVALVVILKPLYNWLLNKRLVNGSELRATGITLVIFVLIIGIPATLIIGGAVSQALNFFNGLEIEGLDMTLPGIASWLSDIIRGTATQGLQLGEGQLADSLGQALSAFGGWLGGLLLSLGQSLPAFFTNAMVTLVIMYVLLPRYNAPGQQQILEIVPFPREITKLFLDKIDLMITAMFKGTFVIAIVSGLVMGLVFWIAGVPYTLFLTLLSMFLSLVPLIGISLLAWPIAIILILTGSVWQGIFIIAAFLIVVANIDTILRPYLVPRDAYLNPALIILSVFGGLSLMGLIGALYGPVIMILLVTSIDVYTKYMLRSDLAALQQEGRIDLKQLGLVAAEEQGDQNLGTMFVNALKNVSARFRRETPVPPVPGPVEDDLAQGAA
jgi:predicted PurR-regulated permease PerM